MNSISQLLAAIPRECPFIGDFPFQIPREIDHNSIEIKINEMYAYNFIHPRADCILSDFPMVLRHRKYTFEVIIKADSELATEKSALQILKKHAFPQLIDNQNTIPENAIKINLSDAIKEEKAIFIFFQMIVKPPKIKALYEIKLFDRKICIKAFNDKETLKNNIYWMKKEKRPLETIYQNAYLQDEKRIVNRSEKRRRVATKTSLESCKKIATSNPKAPDLTFSPPSTALSSIPMFTQNMHLPPTNPFHFNNYFNCTSLLDPQASCVPMFPQNMHFLPPTNSLHFIDYFNYTSLLDPQTSCVPFPTLSPYLLPSPATDSFGFAQWVPNPIAFNPVENPIFDARPLLSLPPLPSSMPGSVSNLTLDQFKTTTNPR